MLVRSDVTSERIQSRLSRPGQSASGATASRGASLLCEAARGKSRVLMGQTVCLVGAAPAIFGPQMTQRRYSDEEVTAIFEAATEGPRSTALQRGSQEGLTLADLQQIGAQVGLTPDAVAQAAHSLQLRPQAASQSFLGLPIGVERTVTLDRRLTDTEWENVIGEMRAVFRANGKSSAAGLFRQWSNGNLRASLEPTETGHRLRLSTFKGSARPMIGVGALLAGAGFMTWAAALLAGQLNAASLLSASLLAGGGIAVMASNALRLRSWSQLRGEQLESIASRVALTPASLSASAASNSE